MTQRRSDVSDDDIRTMYLGGMPTTAIARTLGCSMFLVWSRLTAMGVPLRPVGKFGHRSGASHGRWKGTASGYTAKHNLVRRRRGRAERCEDCGLNDPARRYEWANLTGKYDDPNDYRAMCVSCHRRYDDKGMGRGASRKVARS